MTDGTSGDGEGKKVRNAKPELKMDLVVKAENGFRQESANTQKDKKQSLEGPAEQTSEQQSQRRGAQAITIKDIKEEEMQEKEEEMENEEHTEERGDEQEKDMKDDEIEKVIEKGFNPHEITEQEEGWKQEQDPTKR